MLTNCRRELVHAVWLLLLDDDFVHAYEHGFTFKFIDGVTRQVFPRIFTYGMDYPEKWVQIKELLWLKLMFLKGSPYAYSLLWELPMSTMSYSEIRDSSAWKNARRGIATSVPKSWQSPTSLSNHKSLEVDLSKGERCYKPSRWRYIVFRVTCSSSGKYLTFTKGMMN